MTIKSRIDRPFTGSSGTENKLEDMKTQNNTTNAHHVTAHAKHDVGHAHQVEIKTKLDTIATNTANINVNVGDVEINVNDLEVLQTATNSKLDNIFSRQDDILTASNATKLTNDTIATKTSALLTANHTDLNNIFSRQDDILTSNNATKLTNATIATKITSLESANHTDLGNIFSRQDDILTASNATKLTNDTIATKTSALLTANHTDLNNIFSRQDDILTSTNAVKTNTQSVENCVSSNKMNVNISSGISDLASESTLQIISEFNCDTTDVNVTSLITGVGATNLGKAIQSPQGQTDTGVATLAVRNDALADLAGADHDYAPLQVDSSGALYTRSLATELAVTGTNSILTTIDADTNDIKTSVQLLDNAVDGNYLNVNQNVAGADVAVNSGDKGSTVPRVCIATDDINLSAIKTSVQLLDNAMHTGVIPSSALNVSVASSALPSGASTDNTILSMRVREDEATANGQYLMGTSAVVRQDTLASLVGTDGDNTQMSVNASGALYCINSATDGILTTIDEDTNAIKTSVQLLDNAVDGNYLNVNANIAGTDVDSNSGNKSAATQRVVVATDDVNLSAIKTAVETIDNAIDGSEMQVDIVGSLPAGTNAIGKLSANNGVDIGDVDVTSISAGSNRIGMVGLKGNEAADGSGTERHVLTDSAGHLQIDVLSAPTTTVTGTVTANLSATDNAVLDTIAGDTTSLDGKITACNTGAVVISSGAVTATLSATDNAVLDNSLLKQTLATTSELKELLSGVTINAGNLSSEFDFENYRHARFFGISTASIGTDFLVMGSNASGSTYYVMGENLRSETIGSTHYIYSPHIENLPRYVKIINKSGSTNYIFTKLYVQLSEGRVGV